MAAAVVADMASFGYNGYNISRPARRVSESQSEVSSINTELSETDIALRLGISDRSAIVTERFKVDRQKLENMIRNAEAVTFFESLMENTTTHIYWPSRLRIDAKSKKDVHVKILGIQENVDIAKERVLEVLDSRGSRVTMKMDISFNDHSSIIGTGGNNIKKIMEETNTHIHFPDSNKESKDCNRRNNIAHKNNNLYPLKSNQVSLNGTLEGVEKARAAVRGTSPLTISFETTGYEPVDNKTEYVEKVKQTFDVKVVFKVRPKFTTLVMIKGTEKEASKAQEATKLLINNMCTSLASQTKVSLQMEIHPQHHECVKGKNNIDLLHIMDQTNTEIMFTDIEDNNIPQAKKSHVTIKGSIDGVYRARQQLIGNLPVTLSFDYSDYAPNQSELDALMNKYGVMINTRRKTKQNSNSSSIAIKGKEKFIDKIYEARHELLKLTTPLVKADIPKTYFGAMDFDNEFVYRQKLALLLSNRPESPLTPSPLMGHNYGSQFDAFQNYSPNITRFSNTRTRVPSNNFNNNNFLSPHLNMQPRTSISPITSGYSSTHNSFNSSGSNSIEQLSQTLQQQQLQNSFLDAKFTDRDRMLSESSALFDDDATPTLLDVKNAFNFDQKKIEGYKAMKRALDGESIRTPTSTWAGLGLSKTSPFALETVRKTNEWNRNDISPSVSPYGLIKTTGIVDSTPSNMLLGQYKDIQSLLIHLGLEHYINTFHIHEIDLELFSTLTAENLTTLGIQAFGARKKLLMAIHDLNASKINMSRSTKFSGSAAPGAERRISGDW